MRVSYYSIKTFWKTRHKIWWCKRNFVKINSMSTPTHNRLHNSLHALSLKSWIIAFPFSVPLDLRFQRKSLKRALSWKPKSPGSSHLDKDKGWCDLKTSTVVLAQTVYSLNNWAIMPGLFLSSAPLQFSLYFVIGGGTIIMFTVKIAVNNVMCQYI